ncbi:hypothetical protein HPB48_016317 [Haemaphysalis longicornis]|uniref:Uncharacterized protein n=1 Tax=Haemaphysalis longicornis TaxID=44386 RepID=A0A9J6GX03_HAELO|nr:hypothetical protein HPB48_016317 [Haemaphysalis longicornis]
MNLLYPQLYPSPACPNCQQARGTIYHVALACPNHQKPQDAARLRDHSQPLGDGYQGLGRKGSAPADILSG